MRALKRVNNILEPNNDKIKKDKKHMNISEDLLHKKVEKDLYLEILNLKKQEFEKNDMEKFKEFLYKNCNLSMIINDFFDNIIVNDKNNDLRMNRLHLLSAVIDLTSDLFDIKSIEI